MCQYRSIACSRKRSRIFVPHAAHCFTFDDDDKGFEGRFVEFEFIIVTWLAFGFAFDEVIMAVGGFVVVVVDDVGCCCCVIR